MANRMEYAENCIVAGGCAFCCCCCFLFVVEQTVSNFLKSRRLDLGAFFCVEIFFETSYEWKTCWTICSVDGGSVVGCTVVGCFPYTTSGRVLILIYIYKQLHHGVSFFIHNDPFFHTQRSGSGRSFTMEWVYILRNRGRPPYIVVRFSGLSTVGLIDEKRVCACSKHDIEVLLYNISVHASLD